MPSIKYTYENGKNFELTRSAVDAEVYGMKIIQLLLPVSGHRIHYLDQLKSKYKYAPYRPLINENDFSTLGVIGSVGFFSLIWWLFNKKPDVSNIELKHNLSILNASAVFLGTIGGFGSLISLIFPQIRGYNRLSIFIAFFSLFAVVLFLEEYYRKYVKSMKRKMLFYSFLTILLAIGLLDQTTKYFVPAYASIKTEYLSDKNFISKIEASVPKNTMIFQLPYVAFPGSWPIHKMTDYAHFKGYLHSKDLHWSYGAMRGRKGDKWQRVISKLPLNELVETVSLAGFGGIYIDRYAYTDEGAGLEKELSSLLNTKPIVSANNRLVFFSIPEYKDTERSMKREQGLKTKNKSEQEILHGFNSNKLDMNLRAGSIDIFESDCDLPKIDIYGAIHAAGWAFDPNTKKPAKFVVIIDNGKPFMKVPINLNREDVALTLHNNELLITGWDAVFSAKKIGRGKHRLEFYAFLENGIFAPLMYRDKIYFEIEVRD
jgi:phosphoglycerol transferase